MVVLAVNVMERVRAVPKDTWLHLGLVVLVVIAGIIVLKKAAGMNKIVLAILVFVIGTVFFFNWVYQRNEPAFLTPVIDKIAPFFPSKGKAPGKPMPF
jgi:hypothetical protein